jgi:hypothetical protein
VIGCVDLRPDCCAPHPPSIHSRTDRAQRLFRTEPDPYRLADSPAVVWQTGMRATRVKRRPAATNRGRVAVRGRWSEQTRWVEFDACLVRLMHRLSTPEDGRWGDLLAWPVWQASWARHSVSEPANREDREGGGCVLRDAA